MPDVRQAASTSAMLRHFFAASFLLLALSRPADGQVVSWETPEESVALTDLVLRDLLCRLDLSGAPVVLHLFGAASPASLRRRIADLPVELEEFLTDDDELLPDDTSADAGTGPLPEPSAYTTLSLGPIYREGPRITYVTFHSFPAGPFCSKPPVQGRANVHTDPSGSVFLLPPSVFSEVACQ